MPANWSRSRPATNSTALPFIRTPGRCWRQSRFPIRKSKNDVVGPSCAARFRARSLRQVPVASTRGARWPSPSAPTWFRRSKKRRPATGQPAFASESGPAKETMPMVAALSAPPVTPAVLRERIAQLPRVSLAQLPTPLDEAPRFSAALGGPRILIKREDLTGLAFGGNKSRMLEFRIANALREGADCIINGAAVQSNDCRQTAAAGAKLGLKVYLVLKERRNRSDPHPQGNFLLDKLLGAEVITIGPDEAVSQQQVMTDLAERLRSEGHRPYLSLQDLHLWAVGYVDCFLEIQEQLAAMGVPAGYIYLTSGLMSQAGLVLGARATGASLGVVGVCPSHHQPDSRERMASLATEAGRF